MQIKILYSLTAGKVAPYPGATMVYLPAKFLMLFLSFLIQLRIYIYLPAIT
jgi:hypothetical protein